MQFRVLGPLEVEHEGQLLDLGRPKQRALLAMLVLHANEVVSADHLVEELWPETPPSDPAAALRVQISRLRAVLGPGDVGSAVLETRKPGYVLRVDPGAVDASRFEALAEAGRRALRTSSPGIAVERLEEALSLWRGPALADFAFERFAEAPTARLENLRLAAVEDRMEAELAIGGHEGVVGELRELADQHPLRERLWGQLMVALYRCGRQADALRTFAELRRVLGEELGIEPGAPLQRLEEAILLQKPELEVGLWGDGPAWGSSSAGPAMHNLPAARSSFIGRDHHIAQVDKLLAPPGVISVVGPGGMGKTRLAIELARRVAERYADGVWLVELAPLTQSELVVRELASVLRVKEEPDRSLEDTLADVLHSRQALLVIDNCEHLIDVVAALVDRLLRAAPELTVLATSRQPLRIEGEQVWRLPPLSLPGASALAPEDLMWSDAVRLFVERAGLDVSSLAADVQQACAVGEICRRLDGIPLAIELAGARTGVLTPVQILERLDDRFQLLTGGTRSALPRHQTLRAAIDWSHDLLSGAEQALFRRLSVFAGGFGLEALGAVSCGDGVKDGAVLEVLTSLVDHSLVITEDRGEEVRYDLLETLRAYAAERVRETGEEDALGAAHLAWMLSVAEAFASAVDARGSGDQRWVVRLELEHDNLRHALEWAIGHDPQTALRMVGVMGYFWGHTSRLSEGRRWTEAALAATAGAPLEQRALALRRAGRLAQMQGDLDAARPFLSQALAGFRDIGDDENASKVLSFLSGLEIDYGDYEAVRRLRDESDTLRAGVDDEHGAAHGMEERGWMAMIQGDFRSARPLLEGSVAELRRLRIPLCVAECVADVGEWSLLQGDLAAARAAFEESHSLRMEIAKPRLVAFSVGHLADLALHEGDVDTARSLFAEELAMARSLEMRQVEQHALYGLGLLTLWGGDARAASIPLAESLRLVKAGYRSMVPARLEALAAAAGAQGLGARAATLFGAAEALRESMGAPLAPLHRRRYNDDVAAARSSAPGGAFAAAWARGRGMSVTVAADYALDQKRGDGAAPA